MNLKQKLDYHYKAFDKSQISPDPLQFLHLFRDKRDIETIGFISSIFAYGNVKQIINTMDKIIEAFDYHPYEFVINFKKKNYAYKLKDIKHRFYTEEDITVFFLLLNDVITEFGSIKNLFYKFYNCEDINIKNALSKFSEYFINSVQNRFGKNISLGVKFMFPLPELGSACKRMNLFLRWMVRKDELDFGLWNEIPRHKLIMPVDTHVARICKSLNLTTHKNVGWKMAEEITQNLTKFDPQDPIKYDFAICHIGMRKLIF